MTAPHREAEPRNTRRGFFWLPGEVVEHAGASGRTAVQRGQAFVAWEAPAEETELLPVVLIHGGGGQGTEWMRTPDGRPGWAPLLVDRGHPVYVLDRPGFGRSPGDPQLYGPTTEPFGYAAASALFAPAQKADRHTGWPWPLGPGSPEMDAVVAASAPLYLDTALMNRLDGERVADLLDIIGRSILIAASAGGPAAYRGADLRPELVAAFAGVETLGPAFKDLGPRGTLSWGMAAAALGYEPPVSSPDELSRVVAAGPEQNPAGNPLVLQLEPARTLARLREVPVGIFSTDLSDRHVDDAYTVAFLRQAGVDAQQLRFAEHGVTGSSHGIMFETGNVQALEIVLGWLREKLPEGVARPKGGRTP